MSALNFENCKRVDQVEPYLLPLSEGESANVSSVSISSNKLIFFLAASLIFLQISDGLLTAYAMSVFGTEYEGNLFLRALMDFIGYLPTLVLTKGSAIVVVCLIACVAESFSWIKYALGLTTLIYACLAVLPWCYILSDIKLF